MRASLRSTSTRTFLALPLALLAEQGLRRARLHPAGLPLMAAGLASYKLAGTYRIERAGGPPGMSQGMPEQLVTDGVYAWTRNPMYLGHLTFMTGAALLTRSPLAIGALALAGPWFGRRVAADEARLSAAFGRAYEEYLGRVPRWLPGL
jgi:protein-S-isoprenylcysteine O-methyltransferase Ste14